MGALQVIGGATTPTPAGFSDELGEEAIRLWSLVLASWHRGWLPYPLSRPIHVVPGGAERSNGGVLDGAPLFRLGWRCSLRKV